MDTFDAARTVLAVREYQDRPVPDEVVDRIVESARLTASSMNGQPWHFVVATDPETLQRLGAAVRTGPYIAEAPLAVAVAVERGNPYAVSDASRAIQSMVMTAWEAGVGSNWTGFGELTEVASILGIPDEYDVLAVVPFGYPTRKLGKGRKDRKPPAEVISRERFGEPYP
jgi:nitroreductase